MASKKISTEHYKGVRDFYPQDQFVQRYIFEAMARSCESFGYEEYSASILEPADLYRSKGNQEIIDEQTYTFTDRGDREVTLRPEMTPTVARMIAEKAREIPQPIRWYSIPNVFRYERPQKGRLREHWQLNADIFGVAGIEAEVEILSLAHRVMVTLGAAEGDFEIQVSDRRLLQKIFEAIELTPEETKETMGLLDRRTKVADFGSDLAKLIGTDRALTLIQGLDRASSTAYLEDLLGRLHNLGITNVSVNTSIVRGFDYYTGMVFEVFDSSVENSRSLFGGGRYDNLLENFGVPAIPAVGFGMGDVTARDFLEVRGLIPEYTPATELILCPLSKEVVPHAMALAENLRDEDVTVAVNYSLKKAGEQIRYADKIGAGFIIIIGEKEIAHNQYTIKHLSSGDEKTVAAEHISEHMFGAQG